MGLCIRVAGRLRINTTEPQVAEVKRLDKGLAHANRIVILNKIIKRLGKKRALAAIQALDKSLHRKLPPKNARTIPSTPF